MLRRIITIALLVVELAVAAWISAFAISIGRLRLWDYDAFYMTDRDWIMWGLAIFGAFTGVALVVAAIAYLANRLLMKGEHRRWRRLRWAVPTAMVTLVGAVSLVAAAMFVSARPDFVTPSPDSTQSVWLSGFWGDLLASTDGGATWERQSCDIPFVQWAIAFSDPQHGWLVGRDGAVSRTTDGGRNWSASEQLTEERLVDVACPDADHAWIVGGLPNPATPGQHPLIFATSDGGVSWERQKATGVDFVQDVEFVDSRCGWALASARRGWGSDGYILATRDGGRHWRVCSDPASDAYSLSIAFADRSRGWLVTTGRDHRSGAVLATRDGGGSWTTQVTVGDPLRAVACADAQHAWAVGSEGLILATADGGASWVRQSSGTTNALFFIACTDSRHAWATVERLGLLATTDGGSTWGFVRLPENSGLMDVAAAASD